MKKWRELCCALLFLLLCAGVLGALQRFTAVDERTTYTSWESSAVVAADGSEGAIDAAAMPPTLEEGEWLRYRLTLPEGRGEGQWLLFETAGLEMSLRLNDAELWYSHAVQDAATLNLSQVQLPLPAGGGETLTVDVRQVGETALLPPLVRLTDDPAGQAAQIGYANYYGLPAGASALATVLLGGLFLLGLALGRTDVRLLLPFAAAGLVTGWQLALGYGKYFLPPLATQVLASRWTLFLAVALLLLYLLLAREKRFYLGLAGLSGGSALALAAGWQVSQAQGGRLALALATMADNLRAGIFEGALYWLTWWLVLVTVLLSAMTLAHKIAQAQRTAQAMTLREQLLAANVDHTRERLEREAALRHEHAHQLTTLEALAKAGDLAEIERVLADWRATPASPLRFCEEITVNAILQEAAAKAERAGVDLQPMVTLPEKLALPPEDLCTLLLNMLDNAIEAAAKVDGGWVRIRIKTTGGYLAVLCENSYDGTLQTDDHGRLRSTKPDAASHGFGLQQMQRIASRYDSVLDISHTEDVFTVQTALQVEGRR